MASIARHSAESPLSSWANQTPDSTALVTPTAQYRWSELRLVVERYVLRLSKQGVNKGSVVTLVGKNHPEHLFIYLACLELGAVCAFCMIQPMHQLKQKLNTLYRPEDDKFLWFSEEAARAFSEGELLVLNQIERVSFIHSMEWENTPIEASSVDDNACHRYEPNHLASIVFTSGSTGNPKAVAHTSAQHLASASGLLEQFRFTQGDTWLLSLPMYHVSGLAILYRWLCAGACLKIGDGEFKDDIQGVTHASLVVTQLKRLLDSGLQTPKFKLTHVLLGGSHIPESLALQASGRGIETWIGYGMTEAASTVTAKCIKGSSNQTKYEKPCTQPPSTAGLVLPFRRVRLENDRIFIGGETLAQGYYHQGTITSICNEQGWFDSKDLGHWVGKELRIIGRADNQFISGGENIHCEEIEAAFRDYKGHQQVFVVPIDDEEFGFRPIAIIQCDELASIQEYEHYLNGRLERYKHPIAYYKMPALQHQGIKVSRTILKEWVVRERKHSNE